MGAFLREWEGFPLESPKKVLIVEDEKNIVDILRFNLQRAGYATEEAYDDLGATALDAVRRAFTERGQDKNAEAFLSACRESI